MSAADRRPGASRVVGVLGGMGPRATVDFYDKLVTHTPADTDQEHLRVIIWADPTVPNRQEAILADGPSPAPWLRRGIEELVRVGAEIVVMPCNTAHRFVREVLPQGVEFIDIVDVTLDALRRHPPAAVGLLATDAALASDLFQSALREIGRDVVLPSRADQAQLTEVISAVKSGAVDDSTHAHLDAIRADLRSRGAGVTIAGCTEVSALLGTAADQGGSDVIDPALELALAAIQRARASAPVSASLTG